MEFSLYYINIIAIGFLLYKYQKRSKTFDHNTLLLSSWFLASICGYLYSVLDEVYIGQGDITLFAVIFVISSIIITLYPLTKQTSLSSDNYNFRSDSTIILISVIIAVIGFEPFLESIIHIFSNNVISQMGDYHDDRESLGITQVSHFSRIGVILHRWSGYYNIVAGVLFFNYLNKNNYRINKLLLIGLLCSFAEPTVTSFAFGSRWSAYQFGFLFAFMFLLFWPSLNNKYKWAITRYSLIGGSLIAAGFIIISMVRFGDNQNETLLESIYRYAGEGFNNTYTDMWYVDNHTFGAHIFRNLVGVKPWELTAYTGVRMHVYYTFVGDLICDFSIIGAGAIVVLFSFLINKITTKSVLYTEDIILLVLYVYAILTGYTYIPFMNTAPCIFGSFIIYFVLKFSRLRHNS